MISKQELFDDWAQNYDNYILANKDNFPFCGYADLCTHIQQTIQSPAKIFDIGIGTGYYLQEIGKNPENEIWGIDISEKMIEIVQKRLPKSNLILGDIQAFIQQEWQLPNFDYIVSCYAFHHFTDEEKIKLIQFLVTKLSPNGQLIIGDISFWDQADFEHNKSIHEKDWDSEEYYSILNSFCSNFIALNLNFEIAKISYCSYILKIKIGG